MDAPALGEQLRQAEFLLDPKKVFLNHGSYGTVPKRVLDQQFRLKQQVEADPDQWYRRDKMRRMRDNLDALCDFIGADIHNTVFVENATTGLMSALQSVPHSPGDAVLLSSLQYHAVTVAARHRATSEGIDVVTVELPFPMTSSDDILSRYETCLQQNPKVKVAIIDHISSPSAVVFPLQQLVDLCHSHDVIVIVDGAHVAGQLDICVSQLNADFYVGNLHKWLFTPRGCGFLSFSSRFRDVIRPVVISHFHGVQPHFDFAVRGTADDTPYCTVIAALDFLTRLGGLTAVTRHVTAVLEAGVGTVEAGLRTRGLALPRALQAPFMRLVAVPDLVNYPHTAKGGADLEIDLYSHYNIQVLIMLVQSKLHFRLSAHVYSSLDYFDKLVQAILELMKEPKKEKKKREYELPIMHWDLSPWVDL